MRWKAIFMTPIKEKNNQQRYGLRSFKIPPPVKELAAFESKLIELVKNIKFRKVKTSYNIIWKKTKKINQSDKTLAFAHKLSNMYRLTKEECIKRQRNPITSTYKKQTTSRKESMLKEIMENVDKKILDQIPRIK